MTISEEKVISFWCDACKIDFDERAHRYKSCVTVMKDGRIIGYKYPAERNEWWEAKCKKCGRDVIRYITDAGSDPYFRKSEKVKRQIYAMRKDLIQPGEYGFSTLYGEQQRKMDAQKENAEVENDDKKKNRDMIYDKYKHDANRRAIMKKVYADDDR